MNEEWRPILLGILKLPSNYEVNDQGHVRNRTTGKILKPGFVTNRNGDLYAKVCLCHAGKKCWRLVQQRGQPGMVYARRKRSA